MSCDQELRSVGENNILTDARGKHIEYTKEREC
jgi:hypothetical protein